MKKLIGLFVIVMLSTAINAQKSIDDLFEKYAGKEGFTTVTINGNLLKLAAALDDDNDSDDAMPKNVSFIRVLTQDEDNDAVVGNFYDLVIKDLDISKYEEFMQVKEKDQDMRMLVRIEGKVFKEFLLISGGKDNNALIQIKGDLTFDEAKKFAEDAKKDRRADVVIKKDF
jgi:hypothetical protein